jgi:hypothetical protein
LALANGKASNKIRALAQHVLYNLKYKKGYSVNRAHLTPANRPDVSDATNKPVLQMSGQKTSYLLIINEIKK